MALGIGDTLRATRRQQQLTLGQAAAEIRVREPYLAALEDEKFSALGGDVYVRAFLRGYSEYLGLDPDQMVDAYRRQHERGEVAAAARTTTMTRARPLQDAPPAAAGPPPAPQQDDRDGLGLDLDDDEDDGQPPRRALILAGVVLILIGLAVIALRLFGSGGGGVQLADDASPAPDAAVPAPDAAVAAPDAAAPEAAAPEEEELPGVVVPDPDPPLPAQSEAAAPPASGPLTALQVEVSIPDAESWMRATVDGIVEVEGLQPPGTTRTFTGEDSVVLRIGDASRVRIVLNGVDQGVLGPATWIANVEYRIGEVPVVTTEAP